MRYVLTPKIFILLCLVSVIAEGCATKRVALEEPAAFGTVDIIIHDLTYDENGLPVMGPALAERPSRPGEHFSVVRFADGRPVVSYDIVVQRQKPDLAKPIKAVYEWTGKGFRLGASMTVAMLQGFSHAQYSDEAAAELIIVITPLAAGTAGGFVVGITDGLMQTAVELSKVLVSGEMIVTCTTYEYDDQNRIAYLRMLTPDRKRELVRTIYVYEGGGTIPSRTVVNSLVEGKERDVK